MVEVQTERLTLMACPAAMARAAYRGRRYLETLLGAHVDQGWPTPEIHAFLPIYARQVETAPGLLGWGIWLVMQTGEQRVIGDVGFKGRPDSHGCVDIGYGIAPAYRQQGYAFEAAAGLRDWAFAQPDVQRLTADCWPQNTASAHILAKLGMTQIGLSDAGLLLWELSRAQYERGY